MRKLIGGLAWMALAAPIFSQQIPFSLVVVPGGQSAASVQNGASLVFVASVGQSQTAVVQATYRGTGLATISQQPSVLGSASFRAVITNSLPLQLMPGDTLSFSVVFAPTSSATNAAQLSLPYSEAVGTNTNTGAIAFALQGSASAFTLSYVLQTDQNVIPLQPGGLIPFNPTVLGTTAQAALNITETGTGAGIITGIAISGAAFRLQGVPLLPASVASGQNLQVLILYTPTGTNADAGQVTVSFAGGPPVTINLSGAGVAPTFLYQVISANPPINVTPGGAIAAPDANVGQMTSVTIQVINAGSASGTLSSITVSGTGFVLSGVSSVLPQVLAPGAGLTFTISFTPTQVGAFAGTLVVNTSIFKLTGNGLGPQLTYSYSAGGATIALTAANPSVVFSPVQVTQSSQLNFTVQNSGTAAATIASIGISQTASPYTLLNLPPLPVTVAPNTSFQFAIKFTPTTVGFANGNLLLDSTNFALSGQGTQPPALPSYSITGPSGTTPALTQAQVGLTLAAPYPVAISGQLVMTVGGNLPADPAVQFISGGRTVAFVIPANQTGAQFGAQGSGIGFQTGTVASNITLTPTFATQIGNVDLTPANPTALTLTIAPAAPALVRMQVSGLTATGLTLQITGYATSRTLTSLSVQFTAAKGFSMPTSQFTIDLRQLGTLWFAGSASQAFGGEFSVTVPFTFQLPTSDTLAKALTAVSATVSNDLGTSNSLQAPIQ